MLQHPATSATGGGHSSHRTILTASDGTNHVVYNLHAMSPTTTSNIMNCDSLEASGVVTPIAPTAADGGDLTGHSALDDDLNEFVICEKAERSPEANCNLYLVATTPSPIQNAIYKQQELRTSHEITVAVPATSVASVVAAAAAPEPAKRRSSYKQSSEVANSSSSGGAGNNNNTKFMCTKCGSQFSALRNMKRHFHHECGIEPKHVCEYCPMRFKRRNLLKYHVLRKHTAQSN